MTVDLVDVPMAALAQDTLIPSDTARTGTRADWHISGGNQVCIRSDSQTW